MKLGVKVGPDIQSLERIENTNAQMCEVWFDIRRAHEYKQHFQYFSKKNIDVGLHFWGVLDDGTWTTLAYHDERILEQSYQQIKKTIDIASQNNCQYVNIHPGTRAHVQLDLDAHRFTVVSPPDDIQQANTQLVSYISKLHAYAQAHNVTLTIETVPLRVYNGWDESKNRIHAFNAYELSIDTILLLASRGMYIANDFGHTAASIITDNARDIWKFTYDTTKQLVQQTKLIHLGFIQPPYNGTDMHDSLDNKNFHKPSTIPNKSQMIELLKLFAKRTDVWILVEPQSYHEQNYFEALSLFKLL